MTVSSVLWTGIATTMRFEAPIMTISNFGSGYIGLASGARLVELTKYVANAMVAIKISLMNKIASMVKRRGVDVENIHKGFGADRRIG